jgi:signal transduction histidine kinase
MTFNVRLFRTKVARRIFVLFIVCAVLPTFFMAVISFVHVKRHLNKQVQERLLHESKAMGLSVYERLLLLSAELELVASKADLNAHSANQTIPVEINKELEERYRGVALLMADGELRTVFGHMEDPPSLNVPKKDLFRTGRPFLAWKVVPDSGLSIFVYVAKMSQAVFVAEINGDYLWNGTEGRSAMTEISILDDSNTILFSTFKESPLVLPTDFTEKRARLHSGYLEWHLGSKNYLAHYWPIFLRSHFSASDWIIVTSAPIDVIYAPLQDFMKSFPFAILLAIGVVFMLSSSLIRKSMMPIEILKEATQKVSQGGFGHRVQIKSGDEFESLGDSFNEMSRKLEESQRLLVQTAKMSTIGQMAAGIIHEVKQPLTAISGLVQLSLMDESSGKQKQRLQTALEAVNRLDGILNRFKSFSYKGQGTMEKVSMQDVIERVYKLFEHQFTMKRIHCSIEVPAQVPFLEGDQEGLQQVISNLLINSVHALETKEVGERMIRVGLFSSDGSLKVEVEDNGCGISKEAQPKIFDPFFTTKGPEKGTGLGMAIVESILHKHHASIELQSEVGVGTKFTLSFPAMRH